jgi:hypothetical protein
MSGEEVASRPLVGGMLLGEDEPKATGMPTNNSSFNSSLRDIIAVINHLISG